MKRSALRRGDVVIVDFGATQPAAHIRPALIVQNDRDNARTARTIIVQVTGNLRRAHENTHYLIDQNHPDWPASGLRMPSVVNGSSLFYIQQADVRKAIGHLSPATMQQVSECLKAALGIA
jgi:mRNA-degrading endonuclease toxin of MazEF toxin-antitoxin module